ncbi:MAG: universal stress protein [Sphingomonadales bacterium]|nr:universal stress protein [Sphingomonadales bacterium]
MRSILVLADRSPAMAARLDTALALARAVEGHVTVIVDTPVARFMSVDAMGGSFVATDAIREALENDDAFATEIEGRLRRDDVPFNVVRSEDEPVDALADAARLADVIVLSKGSEIAGEVALATRCPVLLAPLDHAAPMPPARVCVGWDGGNESAGALRAALPLLGLAEEVTLLSVTEKAGGFPATGALEYLSRHGVKAAFEEVQRAGSTEETLAAAVRRLGGDLLVMGAYGRSRMREYLFGGVTRHFLEQQDGPALLLAH